MDKCPQCGFVEVKQTKPVSHHMNIYVNKKTGKVDGAYNEDAPELTHKDGTVVVLQSLWKPEVPSTPVPPKK